jgi:hypothetical protein
MGEDRDSKSSKRGQQGLAKGSTRPGPCYPAVGALLRPCWSLVIPLTFHRLFIR